MPATTTKSVPYPLAADNNATSTDIQALAQWLDDSHGPFTTTQRDALSAALKWLGREIYNSTTKQREWWDGATWQVTGFVRGEYRWFSGDAARVPAGWLVANGAAVSRTTYADLFAIYNAMTPALPYGSGDGSNTFNLPDLRGRAVIGFDNMGGVADAGLLSTSNAYGTKGGAETVTLSATQVPLVSHNHTGNTGGHSVDHVHSSGGLITGNVSADHTHALSGCYTDQQGYHTHAEYSGQAFIVTDPVSPAAYFAFSGGGLPVNTPSTTAGNGTHSHNVYGGTGGISANHNHGISGNTAGTNTGHTHSISLDSAAASTAVNLMQPFLNGVCMVKY